MRYTKQITATLLILFCLQGRMEAAHIVGGDVVYSFLNFNSDTTMVTFRIKVTLYREDTPQGAGFDEAGVTAFGVYRRNTTGQWILQESVMNIGPMNIKNIPANELECVEPNTDLKVEEGFYEFDVTLEIGDQDYMVAYQRCCRNMTIANIFDPGETGAVFDVIITPEAQISGNNSPTFDAFPPLFICAGFPVVVDQSATDLEGDELRYSFCAPFTAGGVRDATGINPGMLGCCDCVRPAPQNCAPPFRNVTFLPPYSPMNPLGGTPQVTIDPVTGLITGMPEVEGQFVVGVCITELRDGRVIGGIRRDFQFNVIACEAAIFARLDADVVEPDPNSPITPDAGNTSLFRYKLCGDKELDIQNLSSEVRFINDYDWTIVDAAGDTIFDQNGANAANASIVFPEFGQYIGNMVVNKGLMCSDTAPMIIDVFPRIEAEFTSLYDTCVVGPIEFTDGSATGGMNITEWNWSFDMDGASTEMNPTFQFPTPGPKEVKLFVRDNNTCQDSVTKVIQYYPAPNAVTVEPTTFLGCTPLNVFLDNLSFPIDESYDVTWDFGDGNSSKEISPSHIYEEPGNYRVTVDIVSPLNCGISRDFGDYIRVLQSPVADFTCDPMVANIFNKTINFMDRSVNAGGWQWDFGGAGSSFIQEPTFTFPDTGVYEVVLTVFHPDNNCPDTLSKIIDVIPTVDFFFPNAFTPNNDSSNDEFLGLGYYGGVVDFELLVFNRWGEMVFETTDPREGWNGRAFNNGDTAPQGVYVYKAKYRDPRGKDFSTDGHITLLR